jgi:hypothetical protein
MSRLRRWPQTASARQAPDIDELPRRGKPLAIASRGNPLIENAAGKKDDGYAGERHPVIVPSIARRLLDAVDHQEFHRPTLRLLG